MENTGIHEITSKTILRKWIAPEFYQSIRGENEKIALMFEQMDKTLKAKNKVSPFGCAAYQNGKTENPISEMKDHLETIPGGVHYTAKIIFEMLGTGTCRKFMESEL